MSQSSPLRKRFIVFWALLIAAPLLTWVDRGFGRRFAESLTVWVAGSLLIVIGLARDSGGKQLGAVCSSRLVRGVSVAILGLLAILAFLGITRDGILNLLIGTACGFFSIWTIDPNAIAFRGNIQRVLLFAFSLGCVLIAGEIIFRLSPVVAITGGNSPGMLRWQLENYDKVVRNRNSLGLRSLHVEQAKPAGVFRILTFGDSFTWGDKIAHTEDTWPYVVERLLKEHKDPAEVVNMAHTGFTTVNEAELLNRSGWGFQPDLILLQYNLNDPLPSGPDYYREGESWLFRTAPLSPVFSEFLDTHSYLYSFINSKVQGFQVSRYYSNGYSPLYADDFSGWNAAQAALRMIGKEASEKSVPLLLVIFPSFAVRVMDEDSYPYADLHRKVAAAAQSAGFEVLDLREVYARFGRSGKSWWALPCDPHPSVEADLVAGQAVTKKIQELGYMRRASAN